MLPDLLKENQKQPHQLEKIIIDKIKRLDTIAKSVQFLKVSYGFITLVEQQLTTIIDTAIISDYYNRSKSSITMANEVRSFNFGYWLVFNN
jgi:hypothetical protein